MSNQVFLRSNGLICNIYEGDQTPFSVDRIVVDNNEHIQHFRASGRPVRFLVNLTRLGRTDISFRLAGSQALKNADFDKMAIFGLIPPLRHIMNFIALGTGKADRVKTFITEQQAEEWLLAA